MTPTSTLTRESVLKANVVGSYSLTYLSSNFYDIIIKHETYPICVLTRLTVWGLKIHHRSSRRLSIDFYRTAWSVPCRLLRCCCPLCTCSWRPNQCTTLSLHPSRLHHSPWDHCLWVCWKSIFLNENIELKWMKRKRDTMIFSITQSACN